MVATETEAPMGSKRVACILQECFLVYKIRLHQGEKICFLMVLMKLIIFNDCLLTQISADTNFVFTLAKCKCTLDVARFCILC